MKGVAAAGQAAVEEAVKAVGQSDSRADGPSDSREVGTAQPAPTEPPSLPKADSPG
jgi:hypothetical protein